jgi:hypothetical protein
VSVRESAQKDAEAPPSVAADHTPFVYRTMKPRARV